MIDSFYYWTHFLGTVQQFLIKFTVLDFKAIKVNWKQLCNSLTKFLEVLDFFCADCTCIELFYTLKKYLIKS